MAPVSSHLDHIKITRTDKHYCEECIKTGDTGRISGYAWSAGMSDAATLR